MKSKKATFGVLAALVVGSTAVVMALIPPQSAFRVTVTNEGRETASISLTAESSLDYRENLVPGDRVKLGPGKTITGHSDFANEPEQGDKWFHVDSDSKDAPLSCMVTYRGVRVSHSSGNGSVKCEISPSAFRAMRERDPGLIDQ